MDSDEIRQRIENHEETYPPKRFVVVREACEDDNFPKSSMVCEDMEELDLDDGRTFWSVEEVDDHYLEIMNVFLGEEVEPDDALDEAEDLLQGDVRVEVYTTFETDREIWNEGRPISEIQASDS